MKLVSVPYALLEAPSALGLFPGGVEHAPGALVETGLADQLGARRAGRVAPPPYDPSRDPDTGLLNPHGLVSYALELADATGRILDGDETPIVIGGDCSILLGNLLALRRRGRYALLFLDGHADFYQPEAEPHGQAASMELALATGRGPPMVVDLNGHSPLVREEDVVVLGRRDAEQAEAAGSQRIEESDITVFDLAAVRAHGASETAGRAVELLDRPEVVGFWIHLDCDVLDDAVMPAVDYRMPGGLSWLELETVLAIAISSGRSVGLDVTIYNPALDPDGTIGRRLVACLTSALLSTPPDS